VVANRLPVHPQVDDNGTEKWNAASGVLATALAPVLRDRDGACAGWARGPRR
jgi:trehalose 6-phosphate synthase